MRVQAQPSRLRHPLLAGLALLLPLSLAAALPTPDPASASPVIDTRTSDQWVTPDARAPHTEYHRLTSKAAGTEVSYHIYVPKVAREAGTGRYPVLYWLHGTGGGLKGIAPLAASFDQAIAVGKIPPIYVVFPNGLGTGMWVDSKDGRRPVETMLIGELIPEIDAHFRTIAAPEGRVLEGFSMGGYGAARIGFKHSHLFAAISILAAGPLDPEFRGPTAVAQPELRAKVLRDTFGDDLDYYRAVGPAAMATQHARTLPPGLLIRHAVGDRDPTLSDNRLLDRHLKGLGIRSEFTVVAGVGHSTMAVLDGLGEARWSFYRKALKAS